MLACGGIPEHSKQNLDGANQTKGTGGVGGDLGGLAVVREIYLLRIKGCGPAGCPVWERLKWTAPYNEIIAMEIQRI